MKSAGIRAVVQYPVAVDKHYFRGLVGYCGHGEALDLGTGKCLAEDLGYFHIGKNRSVAVIVISSDLNRARKHDANKPSRISLGKNSIFFIKADHFSIKAGQKLIKILVGNIVKKLAFSQNFKIFFHFYPLLLKIQQIFRFYYTIIVSENQGGIFMKRKIIKIDEEKCNGCGACAAACHEGAIEMVNGKAKLTREDYCDGLGDCLPACPTNAISFEEREVPAYNEEAVRQAKMQKHGIKLPCGCPGTQSKAIKREGETQCRTQSAPVSSQLMQWPCQIKLVPVNAPYFDGADLLVAADCTAYAYGSFHNDFIRNHITLLGCPKLDEGDYAEKLTQIIANNNIKSVKVVRMEVPCCGGIENAVKRALQASGKFIPWQVVTISTDGKILD